jgi:hypothetical protein
VAAASQYVICCKGTTSDRGVAGRSSRGTKYDAVTKSKDVCHVTHLAVEVPREADVIVSDPEHCEMEI